jgi:hypothetical protein
MPTSIAINNGDTLNAGYDLKKPDSRVPATVTLNGDAFQDASVQADVSCPDSTSYTLTIPFSKQSYSIGASDNLWYPTNGQDQGSLGNNSTSACNGVVTNTVFSAKGTQTTRGAGNAGGPGFTDTDPDDPLVVRFHLNDNGGPDVTSQPTTVSPATYQIVVTAVLTKNANGTYAAALTVKNYGGGTAQSIRLTSASLGGVSPTGNLPAPGDLLPNSFKTANLTFPATAGSSGSRTVLTVGGTYSGGTFGTTTRVVLP